LKSFGYGHFPGDVSLFALGVRCHPRHVFVRTVQALLLSLDRSALPFVREPLALVRRLFAQISDPVPLVGDAVTFAGVELAPDQLSLTPLEGRFPLIEFGSAAIEFTGVLGDHKPR
jgi:hypothetical protein